MILNEDTFDVIAIKCYDNPSCNGIEEYLKDIKRYSYLQKLFKKRKKGKHFNIKLALNHIIILYNLFGYKNTDFLFFKIKEEYWEYLIPFLVFLNYFPNNINLENIKYDEILFKELKEL